MRRTWDVPVSEIVALLVGRMAGLAAFLAPQGRMEGAEWTALNPTRADSKAGSFRINTRTGLWADFATNDRGDALDLVAYLATNGDKGEAIRWARDWLGITRDGASGFRRAAPAADVEALRTRQAEDQARQRETNAHAAMRTWDDAAALGGTLADAYLRGRMIDPAVIGSPLKALRFHPGLVAPDDQDLPIGERKRWPALIAKIETPPGPDGKRGFAIHRTYLEAFGDGRVTKAAALRNPKLTLGTYRGGAIYLTRGAQGLPIGKCPPGQSVTVTEGIEDGLSFAIANPSHRVWAAVSLANMAALHLPANISSVVIAGQNDAPGSPADAALIKAARALQGQGLSVRVIKPQPHFKDWNDAIRGVRKVETAA